MSLAEAKEEAEAVLDSAEMVLETIPEPRTGTAKDLEIKLSKLEKELQDPDSEESLRKLVRDIRDLMEEAQEDAMQGDAGMDAGDEMGMGPGGPPSGGGGPPGGPEGGEPPF